MPLPNLIIIGAQKCGTSILRDYLGLHPDVAMVNHEMNFFSDDKLWRRGIEWYSEQFAEAPVRGEKSPSYAAWPFAPFVPERIKRHAPDATFMYLVRDPIDRLRSAWVHRTRHGSEHRPFEEAFTDLVTNEYVAMSRYTTQLQRFFAHFPQERFLIIDQGELRHNRAETLKCAFRHIGVDDAFTSPEFAAESQAGTEGRWLSPAGLRIVRQVEQVIGKQRTKRVAALASRIPAVAPVLQRAPVEPPPMSSELRKRLADLLADEVAELRSLTGQAFPTWSI